MQIKRLSWLMSLLFGKGNTLRVHYHRYDGDYKGWELWTWDKTTNSQSQAVQANSKDDYGLIFVVVKKNYGSGTAIGLLPRKGEWEVKDSSDRIWTAKLGNEVWILQDEPQLFTIPPDTKLPIAAAFVDDVDQVSIELPSLPVKITDATGKSLRIKSVENTTLQVRVDMKFRPDLPIHQYKAWIQGYKAKYLAFRKLLDTAGYFADLELGAVYTSAATTFRLFAPTATKVTLLIYDRAEGGTGQPYRLERKDAGIWEKVIKADLLHKYYTYRVEGNDPRFHEEKELIDPYSRCNTSHHGRGMIVQDKTPVANRPTFPKEEAIIYEAHIRDFSIDPNSGIRYKGKYLGMTETGTTLKGEGKETTGLDHLVELGINTVQLMPIQDFENDETSEQYNWGYMPVHFNSPDGWYATERQNTKRIEEFKKVVDALHKKGIRVILDVVYNHTAETDSIPYSFNGIAPGYYYRLNEAGQFWNGSGCGNEFRSEAPMARKFILDSVKYWINEYKVDGFRFDLMGLIDLDTMIQITTELHQIDPNILVYGEPWAAGRTPIEVTAKGKQRGRGFAVFNDNFRNALKSSPFQIEPTFLVDGERVEQVKKGIQGSIHDFTDSPLEVINYVECHDNRTFWDQLLYLTRSRPELKLTEADYIRMDKLGAVILFTSQGIPFIQMGQEFLRTKYDVENSYNQPDRINKIDWERKLQYADVVEYYKGLIRLRKAHPMFRLRTREAIEQNLKFFDDDLGIVIPYHCVAFQVELQEDSWKKAIVLLNPNPYNVLFSLPAGRWTCVVDYEKTGVMPLATGLTEEVKVSRRSAMVLYLENLNGFSRFLER
ncbi:MAG: type I pullulanase [Candidatus Competibacteraceae bacterium]